MFVAVAVCYKVLVKSRRLHSLTIMRDTAAAELVLNIFNSVHTRKLRSYVLQYDISEFCLYFISNNIIN